VAAARAVLDRHDPEGLLVTGAPGDEYEPEARDLVMLIVGTRPPTPEAVQAVWRRWFSAELAPEVAEAVSDELRDLRDSVSES
jgi:hypothetical protein